MAIINFYEKYGFSQTDDLEQIQWIITQKINDEENDSFGEGHSEKMFFLQLAREAFGTDESRAKYDAELAESQKKRDVDGDRKAALEKWYGDAKRYVNERQYDLAKTAIDHAMQFITQETVDSAFYSTASQIYACLKLYPQAIEFINQSIVLSPDEVNGYYLKSLLLYTYIYNKDQHGSDNLNDIWLQLKNNCELTIEKTLAQKQGLERASRCYEILAEMYYVYPANEYGERRHFIITGDNNRLAEEYASKALSISNTQNPQDFQIAKGIINDIQARRSIIANLEQQNTMLWSRICEQRASIRDATTYGSTRFGKVLGLGIILAIVGIIICLVGGGMVGAILIIASVAMIGIKSFFIIRNKRIRDTLAQIRKDNEAMERNMEENKKYRGTIPNPFS